MSMLVIRTQVYENYGAHDWDGIGECPQYWKAKGGSEYKILNIPMNVSWEEVVSMAGVEQDNDYFQESIIDWSIEADDYLSWFEQSQLEYDGEILYKEPAIEYNELNERSFA
jgi:hypothetical protein